MFRLVLPLASLLAATPAALGQEAVPRFDVEAHCDRIASVGGSYSAVMDRQCMKMEQADYDDLTPLWADLPDSMRQHCMQIASVGGSPSYMMLNQCVKMEIEAGNAQPGFKF